MTEQRQQAALADALDKWLRERPASPLLTPHQTTLIRVATEWLAARDLAPSSEAVTTAGLREALERINDVAGGLNDRQRERIESIVKDLLVDARWTRGVAIASAALTDATGEAGEPVMCPFCQTTRFPRPGTHGRVCATCGRLLPPEGMTDD